MLFVLLLLVSGLGFFFLESFDPSTTILIPKFWVVFGFMSGLTLIVYFVSLIGIKKGGEASIPILMGGIAIKLIISMFFILIYLQNFKVNSLLFASEFFSLYFLLTSFEVYSLLVNLRHQNKK